ncbi:SIEVE ELEMENT OCCLUSION B protein [Nymphaea thermarum]|nr:SIEVE ELEMENT OCCLUSION B protein [Nymphaea thermarum]
MARNLLKYGSRLFTSSDDSGVMKHVEESHKPDGRSFDVKPVLAVVEQIFDLTAPASITTRIVPAAEDVTDVSTGVDALDSLGCTIHKIACEITCRCSGNGDGHETTMVLLKGPLSHYEWDAKAVLVLAAFAMTYGEFWLTSQLHAVNNPLAKSVAVLKQLPELLEHVDALKPRFDALNNLFAELLALTRCIIEFSEMPKDYISMDTPTLKIAQAYIPTAVYWIVKSVITSSSQVIGLICMGHEYLTSASEAWELSNLAHKVKNIHDHLRNLLKKCLDLIDEKRQEESYHLLDRTFQTPHLDNMRLLRLMFPSQDDCPLILRHPSKKVNIDVLHRKMLVLLISDLQIKQEELSFLEKIYGDTHSHGYVPAYELVWVPIVDHVVPQSSITKPGAIKLTSDEDKVLLALAAKMPWYTTYPHPHHNSAFIRYIKKEWHFIKNKPILVVLDAQGKLANRNALYMVYIWATVAFPFYSSREETLWKAETWKFELVVGYLDNKLSRSISEGKLVCLYGGESIDWIRYFTKEMEKIMKAASINVEMVYVGKNHPNIPVNKNIETIKKEKLSRTWDFDTIWLFWTRLESMMHSKMQSDRSTETDQILQEVITLLTYGNSNYGWAMVSKGSLEMVKAEGKVLINLLDNFDSWKDKIGTDGFGKAFQSGLVPLQSADHCVRLVLPSTSPVHKVSCPECRKIMERYLLFQCCDTQDDSSGPEEDAAATAVAGVPTAAATQVATLPSTVPAQVVAASPPSAGVVTAQATAASPAGAATLPSTVPAQATVVSPPSAGVVAAQATDASPAGAGQFVVDLFAKSQPRRP